MNKGALLRTAGLAALVLTLSPVTTPGTAQEPIVFGVIGDSGEVTPGLRGVAREMLAYRRDRARFDFVLMLGDNIYSDGVGRGIQTVFEAPFADLLAAGVQFYAVLGNHDIRRGTEQQIHYAAWNMGGRRFYAFSKADGLVEFFGLDSTALSDEASALVIAEKARLDNERAALERKNDADGVGTTTAREAQRGARRGCRLHQGAGSCQGRPAGLARRDAGEIPGTMEGRLFAPLDLFRRHKAAATVVTGRCYDCGTCSNPCSSRRRGPGPCRSRSSLRPFHPAARERASESLGAGRTAGASAR